MKSDNNDDVLLAYGGNDVLTGGRGEDVLRGGDGNDIYHWSVGDGNDIIDDFDGFEHETPVQVDTLVFGEGITADDVSWSRNADNLVLTVNQSAETITIQNWFNSSSYQVNVFQFADGSQLNASTITDSVLSSLVNIKPVVNNEISDQTTNAETIFSYTILANTFTDADGDTLSLRATQADGSALPTWLSFDSGTQTFSGTPSSGDVGNLTIRISASESNKALIANVPGWTHSLEWGKYAEQQSIAITLEAGQHYYIEALHKEAWGGDNVAVGWQLPGSTEIEVISADYFGAADNDPIESTASDNPPVDNPPIDNTPTEPAPPQSGQLVREWWNDIPNTDVASLTGSTEFAGTPDGQEQLTEFAGPIDTGDNFGAKISGVFTAPTTGNYTFWVSGDDNVELWLSSDSSEGNKALIANVPGWTHSLEWGKYAEQQSIAINLEAGQQYYIEALHKEAWGGDNVAVGWQLPGSTEIAVISGEYFGLASGSLTGTDGDDTLTGTDNADAFYGMAGNDQLNGRAGDDSYHISADSGQDHISDSAGNDRAIFRDRSPHELWFEQSEDDLRITVLGTDSSLTINDWYDSAADHQIETVQAGNDAITNTRVELLVQAMAVIGAPAAGEITLTAEEQEQVTAAISETWQSVS